MYKDRGNIIESVMRTMGIEYISLENAPMFLVDEMRKPLDFAICDNEVTLTFLRDGRYWDYNFYLDFEDDVDMEFANNVEDYEKVLTKLGTDKLLDYVEKALNIN